MQQFSKVLIDCHLRPIYTPCADLLSSKSLKSSFVFWIPHISMVLFSEFHQFLTWLGFCTIAPTMPTFAPSFDPQNLKILKNGLDSRSVVCKMLLSYNVPSTSNTENVYWTSHTCTIKQLNRDVINFSTKAVKHPLHFLKFQNLRWTNGINSFEIFAMCC